MGQKIVIKLRGLLPWGIVCALFAYLFHLYPPEQVWKATKLVDLLPFSLFALGYFLFIYVVDSVAMTAIISRFSHRVELKEILVARGATYPIMVLNYPAGQAAFAYYLKRRYDIPVMQVLSLFLLLVFVDLCWIIALAFLGSFFQTSSFASIPLRETVQGVTVIACGGILLWLSFWRRWFRFPLFERLRKRQAFHIFGKVRTRDYAWIALLRTPIHCALVISFYIVALTFHAHVPLMKIIGNIPIAILIGTLPITPGGLGTSNAAMVELIAPFMTGKVFTETSVTPAELTFTASLLWMFANYLLKVITGFFLLTKVSKELFQPTPAVPEEMAEQEAAHFGGNI